MFVTEAIGKAQAPGKVKGRITELDYLRAIAFFAVVLQHDIGVYANRPGRTVEETVIFGLIFTLSKFAVPMFVFLSGVCLFYNYSDKPLNLGQFWLKKLKQIYLPYLGWSVFYSYYAQWHFQHFSLSPLLTVTFFIHTLRNILLGTGYYHMWFVALIIQFYFLFPFMLWISRKLSLKPNPLKHCLIGGVGLAWLTLLILRTNVFPHLSVNQLSPVIQFLVIWSDRELPYYLGFFLLGGFVSKHVIAWRQWIKKMPVLISISAIITYIIVNYELFTGIKHGKINFLAVATLKPAVTLFSILEILILYRLCLSISGSSRPAALLRFASKYSFGAYLAHALVLQLVCPIINDLPLYNNLGLALIALVAASALSLSVNWGSKWIFNVPRYVRTNPATTLKRMP